MRRQTPFADIVSHLTPFFVTRQIVCGPGRVGIGQDGRGEGFQISQRADFFEVEVGLETTLKRPIINTRDEPHADADKYRRLHVIIGDANLSEISTYLKVGTTSLVLAMIEDKVAHRRPAVADPVAELQGGQPRPGLTHLLRLRDGPPADRARPAVGLPGAGPQVRRGPVRRRRRRADRRRAGPLGVRAGPARPRPDAVRRRAGLGGQAAAAGGLPGPGGAGLGLAQAAAGRPAVLRRPRRRRASTTGWSPAARWSRLLGEDEVLRRDDRAAGGHPGLLPRRVPGQYAAEVVAASWDSVIFDVGRESLVRVPMMEPERGTKAHVGALFDRSPDARTRCVEAPLRPGESRAAVLTRRLVSDSPGMRRCRWRRERPAAARAGPARRTDEVDEVEASSEATPRSAERHEKLTEDVDASSTRSTRAGGERGGVRPRVRPEGRAVIARALALAAALTVPTVLTSADRGDRADDDRGVPCPLDLPAGAARRLPGRGEPVVHRLPAVGGARPAAGPPAAAARARPATSRRTRPRSSPRRTPTACSWPATAGPRWAT